MSSSNEVATGRVEARNVEHRTVSRVMNILELVVANEPDGLRLADLSEAVAAPKSSIHGLTRGLVATGYLREERGRYVQGTALAGLLSMGGEQLPAAYRHTLVELSQRWDETSVISTSAGDSIINLDAVEPSAVIRASPPLRARRALWPGSYGKCFLAFMSENRRSGYLDRNVKDDEERARILSELDEVRENRVAYNLGATDPQLFGLASPILSADGKTVKFAIGIAGPISRMPSDLTAMAQSVRAAAESLSLNSPSSR